MLIKFFFYFKLLANQHQAAKMTSFLLWTSASEQGISNAQTDVHTNAQ